MRSDLSNEFKISKVLKGWCVILLCYLISADCGVPDFQDELSLNLKSLQDKLESFKKIDITCENMLQHIKVTCHEILFVFSF